jgi:propionyl-CoA synthetase
MQSRYHEVYAHWQRDPEAFWAEAARDIDWTRRCGACRSAAAYGRWFVDGVAIPAGMPSTAMWSPARRTGGAIYDLPLAGVKRVITYARLQTETQVLAAVRASRRGEGRPRHPHMLMVPVAVIAMLPARASARHSVVFGGFAANELATRIDDAAGNRAVGELRPGARPRGQIQPLLDAAIALASRCRTLASSCAEQAPAELIAGRITTGRPRDNAGSCQVGLRAGRHRSALHPLHLGTMAGPKGVVRQCGHMVALKWSMENFAASRPAGFSGGFRCRLGGRPQLHRLRRCCMAAPRSSTKASRSAPSTPARLARHQRARLPQSVHRADRIPRHQEGGPAGQADGVIRPVEIPRCFSLASAPIPTR